MAWTKLCALDELSSGEMRPFRVGAIEVLLVKGEEGVAVIPPSCPHMANNLGEGFFDGCVLTCNKHLWQWNIPSGEPIGEAEEALLKYPMRIEGGFLWVEVEKELLYPHQCEA